MSDIKVYDNAMWPVDMQLASLCNQPLTFGWKSHQKYENSHWNHSFAGKDRLNRVDVRPKLDDRVGKIWDHIESTLLPGFVPIRAYMNGHTYGTEGYPHKDGKETQDRTCIVYLVPPWKREWAGETAIFGDNDSEDIEQSVVPKQHRIVIFPGNRFHVSRGVTRICPHLRLCLVFKTRPVNE